MRTVAAVAMFLFGSTFLWLTAYLSGREETPVSTAWSVVNVLSLAAVAGFTVASWGLYRDHAWWPVVALVTAVVGLVVVVPFLVGLRQIDQAMGDLGVQINIWLHVLGCLAVIAVTRVPAVSEWFTARLG